jgi:hypothetical protein
VIAQLVKDLIHFKRHGNSLDQHRRPNGAGRNPGILLRKLEDFVPQARFKVALDLA